MTVVLTSILLLSIQLWAYEVDNFTDRYSPLPDSRAEMNKETNRRFQLAMDRANKLSQPSCDPKVIREAAENHVCGGYIGVLEKFADKSPLIKKHEAKNINIYSERSLKEKLIHPVMLLAGLQSSVNLNGHYIGVDKFGHFFDEGRLYYQEFHKNSSPRKGTTDALKAGSQLEETYYGYTATGIKSYADIAAGYSGMIFWTQLSKGANPYFRCANGVWRQARPFDWADYVMPSWDEGINCSQYKNPELASAVKKHIQTLEVSAKNNGKNYKFTCPVDKRECINLKEYYSFNSRYLLGPGCLDAKAEDQDSTYASKQMASGVSGNSEVTTSMKSKRPGTK